MVDGPSGPSLGDHGGATRGVAAAGAAADGAPARGAAGADHPASRRRPEPGRDGAAGRGRPAGGGAVGAALWRRRPCRPGRCRGPRTQAERGARDQGRDRQPSDPAAAGAGPLVGALDGQGHRRVEGDGAAAVGRQRHQAASHPHLQAVERPAVRGQVLGRDRPLPRAAGQGAGLCCDEKSQCQALERTQPGLPLGIGHVRTRTHDYTRHGTITLFAALSYLDGKIFSQTAPRHTHQHWLGFLEQLDKDTPGDLTLHLIIDNYATHKHPKVQSWIAWRNARQRRPHGGARIVLHFTPTASSWLNLIERFFRDLTQDVVREGSFTSVRQLISAIEAYLAEHNLAPKRYVWHAKGEDILAKIVRARTALQQHHAV